MPKFKYSLVSDLHVNHPQPSIEKSDLEEFIIVAGDTSNGLDGLKMLNKWKRRGHTVFAVDGNHEHYANLSTGRTLASTTKGFYDGLDQRRVMDIAPDLTIVGTNGWYHVAEADHWRYYMNDCRYGNLSANEVNSRAKLEAEFLRGVIKEAPGKVIVVTHTAPCEESLDPRFAGSLGNQYYFNPHMAEIMEEFAGKIVVWHHGHTHTSIDVIAHGVHIVTNPRGYPRENPGWKPLTMEI